MYTVIIRCRASRCNRDTVLTTKFFILPNEWPADVLAWTSYVEQRHWGDVFFFLVSWNGFRWCTYWISCFRSAMCLPFCVKWQMYVSGFRRSCSSKRWDKVVFIRDITENYQFTPYSPTFLRISYIFLCSNASQAINHFWILRMIFFEVEVFVLRILLFI